MMGIETAKEIVVKLGGKVGSVTRSIQGWEKVFVCDREGCQVGRLTFQNGELTNVKSYKRDYHTEMDDTDLIFMRLDSFLSTGRIISDEEFGDLWERAQQLVADDLAEKKANRARLPQKKRKRLQGKNPRSVLRELIGSV